MSEIFNHLQKLKSIKPDPDYTAHSRRLLLACPPHSHSLFTPLSEITKSLFAISLSAALIVLIIGGFSYLEKSPLPLKLAGLDPSTLKAEAENLQIDINLSTLKRYEETPAVINTALTQTADNTPVYFESVILDRETDRIDLNNPTDETIDQALIEILK